MTERFLPVGMPKIEVSFATAEGGHEVGRREGDETTATHLGREYDAPVAAS